MEPNTIIAAYVSVMQSLAPAERVTRLPQLPGWEETAQERTERYESIARDLYRVLEKEPALFPGEQGKHRTAAWILGVAFMESGFAKDVDVGPCYRGSKKYAGRCDSGRSACMLQLMVSGGTTHEGYSKADLFADRTKCFTSGLRRMRKSMDNCVKLGGPEAALSQFASGSCVRGLRESRARVRLGETTFSRLLLQLDDADA